MSHEFVKVPFYVEPSDGSKTFFLPNCRYQIGYEIGARGKDKEKHIQSYWVALEKLMQMDKPRFRRKNKEGNFGTVTCQPGDVEQIRRDYIEAEILKYGG